jgi:hypothetical protein
MHSPSSSLDLRGQVSFVAALARVRGMFEEMPGTDWTVPEAARLSGLDESICRAIFDALRHAGFLRQRAGGSYVRGRSKLVDSPTIGTASS